VGRVGDSDFLIVAPGTDEEGALKLAERVLGTLDEGTSKHELLARLEMMARFYSASGSPTETIHPEQVLRRATSALRQKDSTTQKLPPGSRIRPFSGN
jgi:GGDEF domain-containing protein